MAQRVASGRRLSTKVLGDFSLCLSCRGAWLGREAIMRLCRGACEKRAHNLSVISDENAARRRDFISCPSSDFRVFMRPRRAVRAHKGCAASQNGGVCFGAPGRRAGRVWWMAADISEGDDDTRDQPPDVRTTWARAADETGRGGTGGAVGEWSGIGLLLVCSRKISGRPDHRKPTGTRPVGGANATRGTLRVAR